MLVSTGWFIFLEDTENVVSWCPRVWTSILVYWLSEWPKNPLSHRRRGYRGFGRLYPARPDCLLNSCILSCYHITRTTPQAISLENHMKKASYEGRTRQVIGSEKRVRPCSKSVMIDADSLRQKNSETQHLSYDKMLIEWVRSGRVRASWPEPNIFLSGLPTQSVSIYHLPKVNVQEKNYYDPGFLSWGMLNYIPRVGVSEVIETFVIGALRQMLKASFQS